jgi:hypothetical protein
MNSLRKRTAEFLILSDYVSPGINDSTCLSTKFDAESKSH